MRVKNRLLEIRLKMGYKFQKDFAEFFGESAVDIARAGYVQNICTGPRRYTDARHEVYSRLKHDMISYQYEKVLKKLK
ncbi:hypothetical protein [Tepidanaerobacter acetatoxydans]|uniref:hypothetical protein n=1 Tax=Tepidanaerobacter acetatoxydans TaxID=499229 RepID=UPI0026ECEB92|nr:hypothetical protein [Tepidanaerobacter acetatoxydans]